MLGLLYNYRKGKRMKKVLLLLIFMCFGAFAWAEVAAGTFDGEEFCVFVPHGLKKGEKYPLIIGFSAGGKGKSVVNTWQSAAEKYKCIIIASNVVKNGMDVQKEIAKIKATVKEKLSKWFPIDENKILALGSSGGGMAAHIFSFFHSDFIKGVISNVGYIHEGTVKQKKVYPKNKVCVFLASPTDFNYKLMKEDRVFLESLGWACKWIEFAGGHTMAPEFERHEALSFVLENME
jgi:hypothetical protein